MQFKGIADPEQLGVLRKALDQYCLAHDITRGDERHHIATLIVRLFGRGLSSVDEIIPALEEIVARNDCAPGLAPRLQEASLPHEGRPADAEHGN